MFLYKSDGVFWFSRLVLGGLAAVVTDVAGGLPETSGSRLLEVLIQQYKIQHIAKLHKF